MDISSCYQQQLCISAIPMLLQDESTVIGLLQQLQSAHRTRRLSVEPSVRDVEKAAATMCDSRPGANRALRIEKLRDASKPKGE